MERFISVNLNVQIRDLCDSYVCGREALVCLCLRGREV